MDSLELSLKSFVEPWYASLKDPGKAQGEAFGYLMERYAQTEYGKKYSAGSVSSVGEFQAKFPVSNYESLKPYFDDIQSGKRGYECLFPEPVATWVMTRGTTGRPKVIPTNETHLSQILFAGARAIVNFALTADTGIIKRNVLNLNFPSDVSIISTPSGKQSYGYSSGTYARLHPSLDAANLVPRQEEIDSLGPGITRKDWERRFDLVYKSASGADVGCVMGVTPVLLQFARFVRKKYHVLPRDVWKMDALFCTSVAKIQTRYAPELKHFFGAAPVVEMYTATEGVFAQQLDENPYVCPNYDIYLFEVRVGNKIKLLHELRRNEWGRLVVSSVLFPRYEIGDLVESLGKGYFRVFGRDSFQTILEHSLYNAFTGRGLASVSSR
ncbi:MAG TPA: GH3 auxin-responsive promoter family protein [Nitrososphaerales archaeon]|nr:GH3 auxin-responsive promoter family protein [Nitrososphaerales archaeon]